MTTKLEDCKNVDEVKMAFFNANGLDKTANGYAYIEQAALLGIRLGIEAAAKLQEVECNCGEYGCLPVARAKSIRALSATAILEGEK